MYRPAFELIQYNTNLIYIYILNTSYLTTHDGKHRVVSSLKKSIGGHDYKQRSASFSFKKRPIGEDLPVLPYRLCTLLCQCAAGEMGFLFRSHCSIGIDLPLYLIEHGEHLMMLDLVGDKGGCDKTRKEIFGAGNAGIGQAH